MKISVGPYYLVCPNNVYFLCIFGTWHFLTHTHTPVFSPRSPELQQAHHLVPACPPWRTPVSRLKITLWLTHFLPPRWPIVTAGCHRALTETHFFFFNFLSVIFEFYFHGRHLCNTLTTFQQTRSPRPNMVGVIHSE